MKIRTAILVFLLLATIAFALLFTIMQERERDGHWPWPLNGQVINQSAQPVQVWDDDHGSYTVAAGQTSSNSLDVDHAQEYGTKRWCKLGAHSLLVKPDGRFDNCPCFSLDRGRPCIVFQ